MTVDSQIVKSIKTSEQRSQLSIRMTLQQLLTGEESLMSTALHPSRSFQENWNITGDLKGSSMRLPWRNARQHARPTPIVKGTATAAALIVDSG
jgi:hypothetical protein